MSNARTQRNRALASAALASTLALGSTAFAMTPVQQAAPAPAMPQGGCGAHFTQADANRDGRISRAEFDAENTTQFNRMDANHDGFVTGAEMHAFHHPANAAPKAGEGKCGEGKCGEGRCGASTPAPPEATAAGAPKASEGKCGEGRCGADMMAPKAQTPAPARRPARRR